MDLYEKVMHLLEGRETHHYTWHEKDGSITKKQHVSFGPERWINRVKKCAVLSGDEFLAVILFVLEDFTDLSRDGKKIVFEWSEAIKKALGDEVLIARSRDSYLPLSCEPDNWDFVIFLENADAFVGSLGMGWTCTNIVNHLYDETFPGWRDDDSIDSKQPIKVKYSTENLNIINAAVAEFWENHDPDSPPKKEAVTAWLAEKKVSKRIAAAMDTIMRSDLAKKGGNKKATRP